MGEYLFTQRTEDDRRIAETLAEQFGDDMVAFDALEMFEIASETAQKGNSRVLVLDPWCVVQVDTDSALTGTRFITREIDNVLGGEASDYGYYDVGRGGLLRAALTAFNPVTAMTGVYARGMYDSGRLTGVLVYMSTVQEIYENLREIRIKILCWLAIVAVAVILVNLFVLRTITRPISELNEGIARMSRGDLTGRVSVRGHNEFTHLAEAFNSMSERLEQLDRSRSQFVSNASHELKTPLSTMKILIETLLYQDPIDPGMAKEFLGDVNKEIDRLNFIVSDLLTLVNIDSGAMKLNLKEVDMSLLLQEQAKRLAPLARENGIELDCVARDAAFVTGDASKLQQVIYNVIDNAIKYTPRGGEVHCTATRTGRWAQIRIADTGEGIPASDLPHIFDRFYRVDKARSRETGGTGLGLSIVKQIVVSHGGSITPESTVGKGTTFTILLPLSAKKPDGRD